MSEITELTAAVVEQTNAVLEARNKMAPAVAAAAQTAADRIAVAADRGAAQSAAGTAQQYAANAAAVVTSGENSLVPAPGKKPLADSYGRLPFGWSNQARLQQVLQYARQKVVRVYHGGTSIENASNSGTRHWLEALIRQFGDSGNETELFGVLGGSYENAVSGWKKQPFGGMIFTRLRGDPTSTALTFNRYLKRLVIRYSTEADGGSCEVSIDGESAGTINCNAAQSYNNEFVLTFQAAQQRNIVISPPTSGYIYLEAMEVCQDKPGIHVIDASLGGSSINNMVVLRAPSGAQVPGVAIGPNVSVDSMFARNSTTYKPDVAIVAWTVNDAGLGMVQFANTYTPALQRIVAQTKAVGTQLILVIEMAGHYAMANNVLKPTYDAIRALMHSFEVEPHVTVIDWHAASRPDVIATWAARFYPTAVFNEAAGTVTSGDFIHPVHDGHAILADMLCIASGIPSVGMINGQAIYARGVTNRQMRMPGALGPYDPFNAVGTVRTEANSLGVINTYRCVGRARYVAGASQPLGPLAAVWTSDGEVNHDDNINAQVAAAATSDEYGAYKDFANYGYYPGLPNGNGGLNNGVVTLLFVVAPGAWAFRVHNYANNAPLNHIVQGKSVAVQQSTGAVIAGNNYAGEPQLIALTVDAAQGLYVQVTGRIYQCWATATSFPCIPGRKHTTARDLTVPMLVSGDLAADQVILGQSYIEKINGKTIERIAIGREVFRPVSGTWCGLYRLADRTGVSRTLLVLNNVASSAYDSRLGGLVEQSNDNPNRLTGGAAAVIDYGNRYTLTGRIVSESRGIYVYYFNGSNGRYLFLDSTLTWQELTYGAKVPVLSTGLLKRGKTFALTFDMPSLALAVSGSWQLRVEHYGAAGAAGWLPFVLCEGSAAVV